MNAQKYMKMRGRITSTKSLKKTIDIAYKISAKIHYIAYPLLLIYLLIFWDMRIIKVLVVPLVTFVGATVVRAYLNYPRPYEVLDIKPLYPKSTKGKSCPSRHVVSSVIISFAFLYINIWIGIASFFVTLVIAVLRPVAGVHFVRDVIWAIFFSCATGIIGFFVI